MFAGHAVNGQGCGAFKCQANLQVDDAHGPAVMQKLSTAHDLDTETRAVPIHKPDALARPPARAVTARVFLSPAFNCAPLVSILSAMRLL